MTILCQEDFKEQKETLKKLLIYTAEKCLREKCKSGYIVYCMFFSSWRYSPLVGLGLPHSRGLFF